MTRAETVAYIQGQVVAAEIAMQGMLAENKQRERLEQSMAYVEKDFLAIGLEYVIHHNDVLSLFDKCTE